jgi:hypothetical protein
MDGAQVVTRDSGRGLTAYALIAGLAAAALSPASLEARQPSQSGSRAAAGGRPSSRASSSTASAPPAAATPEDAAAALLLERAASSPPGTYTVSGTTLAPSRDVLPLVVQADALRGPDKTVQVTVALGSRVTRPAVTRARILSDGAVAAPRVLSEISGTSAAGFVRSVGTANLPPGRYQLHAVVAERTASGAVQATVARSPLVVPDLWQDRLALGPLVLADAAVAAPASASGGPFAFGPTLLRPATSDRFEQGRELYVGFRAFNWTAPPEQAPDLEAEYVFYERTARARHFFNKLKPQPLNARTLGQRFNPATGVVSGGMTIPLAPFPPGEFELTVRVTDKRSRQVAVQETRFTIVP